MRSSWVAVLLGATASLAASPYAPSYTSCPSPLVRLAGTPQQGNQTLNTQEAAYIASRKALVPAALSSYLGSRASSVYNGSVSDLTADQVPTLAIALSGGGDRAALYAAGFLNALDARNQSSTSTGLGGLLQTASYMSALSGGSWALTSIIFNDFPSSFYDLVLGNTASGMDGWNLAFDLFSPGGTNNSLNSLFFSHILADLAAKKGAGDWNVTFGDYWARALSYHFLPGTTAANFFSNTTSDHGASYLFSNITSLSSYQQHLLPFPIIVADTVSVHDTEAPLQGEAVPLNDVVYELTPLEFGSYDPELAALIPMADLGSYANAGTPYNGGAGGQCAQGFDNAGFITGISSNLFHAYNLTSQAVWTNALSPVNVAWKAINSTFYSVQPMQELDVSAVPNPFRGVGHYEDIGEEQLRLMDGGLDGEVDPLPPLLVKARNIDIIVVADATADSNFSQPNGDSLIATALRVAQLPNGTTTLPPLPKSVATFTSQNLTNHPTFFGCDGTASKMNGTNSTAPYPFIVWIPNYYPAGITNTSTGQIAYPDNQTVQFLDTVQTIMTNGFLSANGSADAMWPTCLACAVVERTRGKTGVDRTSTCETCFSKYCWNGVENAASGGNSSSGGSSGGASGSGTGGSAGAGAKGAGSVNSASAMILAGVVGAAVMLTSW